MTNDPCSEFGIRGLEFGVLQSGSKLRTPNSAFRTPDSALRDLNSELLTPWAGIRGSELILVSNVISESMVKDELLGIEQRPEEVFQRGLMPKVEGRRK